MKTTASTTRTMANQCRAANRRARPPEGLVSGTPLDMTRTIVRRRVFTGTFRYQFAFGLSDARRPVEQAAPLGQRWAVCHCAALTAPRQMPTTRAGDAADQHAFGPRQVAARASHRRPGPSTSPTSTARARRQQPCLNARRVSVLAGSVVLSAVAESYEEHSCPMTTPRVRGVAAQCASRASAAAAGGRRKTPLP